MIVYKVVRKIHDRLFSAIVKPDSNYAIEYEVGRKVLPKPGTYIFVFDDLERAKRFRRWMFNDEIYPIYECETDSVKKIDTITYPFVDHDIAEYWKSNSFCESANETSVCSNLTLIRKIA